MKALRLIPWNKLWFSEIMYYGRQEENGLRWRGSLKLWSRLRLIFHAEILVPGAWISKWADFFQDIVQSQKSACSRPSSISDSCNTFFHSYTNLVVCVHWAYQILSGMPLQFSSKSQKTSWSLTQIYEAHLNMLVSHLYRLTEKVYRCWAENFELLTC